MFWARLLVLAAALALSGSAMTQTSPGFVQGTVLNAGSLNTAFQAKTDWPLIVPATNLAAGNVAGGVTGILPVTNGGTGSNTSTGSGSVVLATAPTIGTSETVPLVIGGTAVGSSLTLQSTSGVGTTDFIRFLTGNNGATEAVRILDSGFFGVGTAAPQFKLHVNTNAGSLASFPPNATAFLVDADTVTTLLALDAYGTGANPVLSMRAARGTGATPAALQSGDFILTLSGSGYGTSAFSNPNRALMTFSASENWTNANHGTQIAFSTVTSGGDTRAVAMTIQNSGGVSVGTVTDPGIGALLTNTFVKATTTIQHVTKYSAAGTPLPTCNAGAEGTRAAVSDATAPTYLATYVSGGAVHAPVYCDGTNWKMN
jgi:hypothetical protein